MEIVNDVLLNKHEVKLFMDIPSGALINDHETDLKQHLSNLLNFYTEAKKKSKDAVMETLELSAQLIKHHHFNLPS